MKKLLVVVVILAMVAVWTIPSFAQPKIYADRPVFKEGDEWTFKPVLGSPYTLRVKKANEGGKGIVTTRSDAQGLQYRDEHFTVLNIEEGGRT